MIVYVGGYTSADRRGRADGISVFQTGAPGEPWQRLQLVATADNPSLLRIGPDRRTLYAVHGARTTVSAWSIDPASGLLAALNAEECGGVNPVDLGFTWDGRFVVVANYTSSTVATLPVDGRGLGPLQFAIRLQRPGTDAASLPHGVTFDPAGRFALIPDKGLDAIFVFRPDAAGTLSQVCLGLCEPGSGPRHAAFHPSLPVLYAVNELACSVQSFRWDVIAGTLAPLQHIRSLPEGAEGLAAEIAVAPDGRSVYVSNRGHDTIAHFPVDAATGMLGAVHCTPCGGNEPRFFALSPGGGTLHVANQGSDTIVSFPLDAAGRLGAGVTIAAVGSPTAICFAETA